MKRFLMIGIINSIAMILLSGCAAHQPIQVFNGVQQLHEQPVLITAPSSNSNFKLIYGNDPGLATAFNRYIKTGRAPNINTYGFIKYAYNPGQQPIINVTPLQITVISLEPGERFTNISSGDPNRWSYSVALSGVGDKMQQNVLVKPSPPDQSSMNMATNLVITTDKRLYNIRLICSLHGEPTKNVSFWYPDEMVDALNNATDKQFQNSPVASISNINLNQLNFNYSLSSGGVFNSSPSWKPIRVFDDGVHTYIQFSPEMSNRDMPALFVSNGDTKELVNYRFKSPYMVVDKIFKQAVLVMGVGFKQVHISIINNYYS